MECICYEEPEMCLHPQLQLQMAKLLVRMVNKGIRVIATTHSDIIIQHINNMCQLKTVEKNEAIEKVGLEWQDLIDIKKKYSLDAVKVFGDVNLVNIGIIRIDFGDIRYILIFK